MKKILISIIFTILITTSVYCSDSYKCVVKETYTISEQGIWEQKENKNLNLTGKEFVVNRTTGYISGPLRLKNYTFDVKPKVLHKGSNENSLKVITIDTNGSIVYVQYLYVQSFNTTKEKPFYFVDGNWSYCGTCLEF
ncbi:hypothetical protein [Desulfobacula sp.]|jgi:hypothetical protein|uniref:hypothetical protein n=1 Tax=Desulfobacula sp. TaxID=2593537 RepID=UPI001D533A48|nr:hypothetical protein [Desulfobacula sp.]